MNKQSGFIVPLIIIIVAALAVGGGVYAVKKSKKASPNKTAMENNVQAEATATTSMKTTTTGSLRDFLALNKNMVCTFNETQASSTVSGTAYIAGSMMRVDSMVQASSTMDGHMIKNGDTMYAWSGTQGARLKMDQLQNPSVQGKASVNLDQKVGYSCLDWTPDQSKFAVPTNVKFVDVSAMMEQMKTKIKTDIKIPAY